MHNVRIKAWVIGSVKPKRKVFAYKLSEPISRRAMPRSADANILQKRLTETPLRLITAKGLQRWLITDRRKSTRLIESSNTT
jgi:hypothetical protein